MAWTTPKTDFANGDVLNATQMNNIGNNLQFLYDDLPTLLSTTTITGSSVTISSISSAYRNLRLVIRDFAGGGGTVVLGLRLNGVTTANYESQGLDNTTAFTETAQTSAIFTNRATNFYWSGSNGLAEIRIPDYTNTDTYKMMIGNCVRETAGTGPLFKGSQSVAMLRSGTSAVTSITILDSSGGGTLSGTALLYGEL